MPCIVVEEITETATTLLSLPPVPLCCRVY